MTTTWTDPAPVAEPEAPPLDPIGLVLADALREIIYTGATTSDRSLQTTVGPSEIGTDCDRQLAYRIAETPPVNLDSDPLPSIVGTGFHLHMEKIFSRLDRRRWLVEVPVEYRGIRGTCDLYDRRRRLVIDWKSTSKGKLRRLRNDGPPIRAQVQIQIYAQALIALGEDPQRVALVYVPRDGGLDDLWVWSSTLQPDLVGHWVGRFERLVERVATGEKPADFNASPSRLCGWCAHHNPASTDPNRGCPGPNL